MIDKDALHRNENTHEIEGFEDDDVSHHPTIEKNANTISVKSLES